MLRKRKLITQVSLWMPFVIATSLLASCRSIDEPQQVIDSSHEEVDEMLAQGSVEGVVAILEAAGATVTASLSQEEGWNTFNNLYEDKVSRWIFHCKSDMQWRGCSRWIG